VKSWKRKGWSKIICRKELKDKKNGMEENRRGKITIGRRRKQEREDK